MKSIKCDLEEIGELLSMQERTDYDFYLNTETGEIISPPIALISALEENDEEALSEISEDYDEDEVTLSKDIVNTDSYLRIDDFYYHPSDYYNLMREWIDLQTDEEMCNRLDDAIRGRGAFRRFKDLLFDYGEKRDEWFEYEKRRKMEMAKEWIESHGYKVDMT